MVRLMEISNSIVTASHARLLQENRQIKPEQNQRVETRDRQSENRSSDIDSDEIVRRGAAIQADRVQKVNNLESAPFQTQQALNSYQQTLDSAQQYEQGELVGVDFFV